MRTIVLDTNVLLADPSALLAFPDSEVVIPETVLGELDKLKTSRVDPDLRFRGREVSRALFDLSEQGNLVDGVELPENGRLRVVPLRNEGEMPEGLSGRNADDRILAVAIQESHDGSDVTLVTNDLNMLLKAQTLGVRVFRHGDGIEASFGRRYIIRPFQRYRIPLTILMISLAVFAAIIVLVMAFQPATQQQQSQQIYIPTELRDTFTTTQLQVQSLLVALQQDPNDIQSRLQLANTLYDSHLYRDSTKHFELYLQKRPNDLDVKTDLGSAYFYSGQTDQGIRLTNDVLEKNPNHTSANFNLGIMYWQGKHDYQAAYDQFAKVVSLTANATQGSDQAAIGTLAKRNEEQVKKNAESAGVKLRSGGVQ